MSVCEIPFGGAFGLTFPRSKAISRTVGRSQTAPNRSPAVRRASKENTVELMREILNSKPSEQVLKIQFIKMHVSTVEILKTATALGTGSARTMAGSLISEMDDAWSAWSYLSGGNFGEDAISYIGEIFETPDQNGEVRAKVLMELAANYSDNVKEFLLDELVGRGVQLEYANLLDFLKNDASESIRDYAQSLD